MKIKIVGLASLGILLLFLGRLSTLWIPALCRTSESKKEVTNEKKRNPNTARLLPLPNDPWIIFRGKGNSEVSVTQSENKAITHFSIKSNIGAGIGGTFDEKSGRVLGLGLSQGKKAVRDWHFRQDGTLKYKTVYAPTDLKFPNTQTGERIFYRKDGSVEKTATVQLHN